MDEQELIHTLGKMPVSGLSGLSLRRKNRITAQVEPRQAVDILAHLQKTAGARLCAITGLDKEESLRVLYHIDIRGILVTLEMKTDYDQPSIRTVSAVFPNAELHEKELESLFGLRLDGLKPCPPFPLGENWPEQDFPLRKDYALAQEKE